LFVVGTGPQATALGALPCSRPVDRLESGEDIRKLPLHLRKASLARLFARRVDGILLSDFEQGEIGTRFRYVAGANRAIVRSESA